MRVFSAPYSPRPAPLRACAPRSPALPPPSACGRRRRRPCWSWAPSCERWLWVRPRDVQCEPNDASGGSHDYERQLSQHYVKQLCCQKKEGLGRMHVLQHLVRAWWRTGAATAASAPGERGDKEVRGCASTTGEEEATGKSRGKWGRREGGGGEGFGAAMCGVVRGCSKRWWSQL